MKIKIKELDEWQIAALVAEKVMGWRQDKPKTEYNFPFWESEDKKFAILVCEYSPWNKPLHALCITDYFDDISILRRDGKWQVRNETHRVDDNATDWYDDLCHALCIYGLRAKGAEVEE